ncbi:MAG: tRNA (N(6)-L-threonylcarbamoyladenosine(37)-C(2))-methylthiotransferase MtaB [bacterium]|nr:tRNA (N(6)-L-threonylcarbamoyladenosine(37)-C(2))-methylthiotransferase MtaB [bacterium]
MKQATVAIANLGCKANQYDGTYLSALLQEHRFQLVDFKEVADIYIVNTCTVTDRADQDSRNLVRRAHRRNPDAIKIVTGCYAQIRPEEVSRIEGVNLVLGNNQKASLLDYLEQARRERDKVHVEVEDIFQQKTLETFGMSGYTRQTRAYVKIQDGCNQFCTFCVIPYARGRNRSIPIPHVIEELRKLSDAGFHEAILTGIHIGTYGKDSNEGDHLISLMKRIEAERPIHRVRLSSIDPEEVTDEMVEFLQSSEVFCPHLHIPLQSGDDATLALMRRRYSRREFFELCHRLQVKIPHLGIGTDVMVGFPYEDEVRFSRTYGLLEEAPVHYFHVFPFSPKRGTPAAKMLAQVSPEAKKERAAKLRQLSEQKSLAWRQKFIGKQLEVVLERKSQTCHNGMEGPFEAWTGYSEQYLPVTVHTSKGSKGKVISCTIDQEIGGTLAGTHFGR